MTTRKPFSSVNKLQNRGMIPRNALNAPVHRIGIPTIDTVNLGEQSIVKPLSMDEPERSVHAKNCFFHKIHLEDAGLTRDPSLSFSVKLVNYNGTHLDSTYVGTLRLLVLEHKDYIFMRREHSFIDKMILPRHAIHCAYFDLDSAAFVLVLLRDFGYWAVHMAEPSACFYSFLVDSRKNWIVDLLRLVPLETLAQVHAGELLRRENSYRDPVVINHLGTGDSADHPDILADDVLLNGLPSELLPPKPHTPKQPPFDTSPGSHRLTRSQTGAAQPAPALPDVTADLDSSDAPLDDDVQEAEAFETPAPFSPPLRYSVPPNKNFTIAANDFKTLYNASWVNDTLIDFFIAYEIEHAITELHTVERSQIYAFNSFFHTKLMSSPSEDEQPPYYDNIRKWLEKLDLMSYQFIVIPIMENAHWFCVVINGLPALLEHAKKRASADGTPHDPPTSCATGPYSVKPKPEAAPMVDVFILDSLRLSHPKLIDPIKMVLREHCRERHGVTINTELIKTRASRVPRQRNTSDCGIHVIYNLKKWLMDPPHCELMWRKRTAVNGFYFTKQERSTMRKWCIDLLLKLHSEQLPPEDSKSAPNGEEAHSDDDVEEISYVKSEPAKPSQPATTVRPAETAHEESPVPAELSAKPAVSAETVCSAGMGNSTTEPQDAVSAPESATVKPEYYTKTLDPRVSERKIRRLGPFDRRGGVVQIEHPQVRKLCMQLRLSRETTMYLNEVFIRHETVYDETLLSCIVELTRSFEDCVQNDNTALLRTVKSAFAAMAKRPRAPKDAPFVIEEASADESLELNRSVGDLRIDDNEAVASAHVLQWPHSGRSASYVQILAANGPRGAGDESDVEVLEKRVVMAALSSRVTRREMRTRGSKHSVLASIEVASDSEDDGVRVKKIKSQAIEWSSPKRRRLD
ncbi:cysteine proteinase [Metschnikowia bicuspidata]|uniref:Cysteine proteinase n=1 Tax=Metschnikowia bicuspidata TaxID=27322 RepID=A0A4P9ZG56_9ASCO|nr:cysteine proteinase [Metschnikowia bicuspidata]